MIPNFTPSGMLPPGIHWSTWPEFVERFGFNSHRKWLLAGLEKAITNLKVAGCRELYIDGSFVTDKDHPGDYDACWYSAGVNHLLLDPVFLKFENKRAAQKAKFRGEFLFADGMQDPKIGLSILNFFQMDKETGKVKGIIGIKLQP